MDPLEENVQIVVRTKHPWIWKLINDETGEVWYPIKNRDGSAGWTKTRPPTTTWTAGRKST